MKQLEALNDMVRFYSMLVNNRCLYRYIYISTSSRKLLLIAKTIFGRIYFDKVQYVNAEEIFCNCSR